MKAKPKILVVEDDQALREIMVLKFSKAGFEVTAESDGEAGLAAALRSHPDMILLDIMMPKMDGLAVLENLRKDEQGKKIPVIMLTNLSDMDSFTTALRSNAVEYFVKTKTDLNDLIAKVKEKLRIN